MVKSYHVTDPLLQILSFIILMYSDGSTFPLATLRADLICYMSQMVKTGGHFRVIYLYLTGGWSFIMYVITV